MSGLLPRPAHSTSRSNNLKRNASGELHGNTSSNYGGQSATKKMKVNEKESLATAYGKPATVMSSTLVDTTLMVPPASSTTVSLSHFSGTWKLDTETSETLYSYLHAMGVSDLAIEAAMKAEAEDDTYQIIAIVQSHMEQKFTITRKSRMSDKTM